MASPTDSSNTLIFALIRSFFCSDPTLPVEPKPPSPPPVVVEPVAALAQKIVSPEPKPPSPPLPPVKPTPPPEEPTEVSAVAASVLSEHKTETTDRQTINQEVFKLRDCLRKMKNDIPVTRYSHAIQKDVEEAEKIWTSIQGPPLDALEESSPPEGTESEFANLKKVVDTYLSEVKDIPTASKGLQSDLNKKYPGHTAHDTQFAQRLRNLEETHAKWEKKLNSFRDDISRPARQLALELVEEEHMKQGSSPYHDTILAHYKALEEGWKNCWFSLLSAQVALLLVHVKVVVMEEIFNLQQSISEQDIMVRNLHTDTSKATGEEAAEALAKRVERLEKLMQATRKKRDSLYSSAINGYASYLQIFLQMEQNTIPYEIRKKFIIHTEEQQEALKAELIKLYEPFKADLQTALNSLNEVWNLNQIKMETIHGLMTIIKEKVEHVLPLTALEKASRETLYHLIDLQHVPNNNEETRKKWADSKQQFEQFQQCFSTHGRQPENSEPINNSAKYLPVTPEEAAAYEPISQQILATYTPLVESHNKHLMELRQQTSLLLIDLETQFEIGDCKTTTVAARAAKENLKELHTSCLKLANSISSTLMQMPWKEIESDDNQRKIRTATAQVKTLEMNVKNAKTACESLFTALRQKFLLGSFLKVNFQPKQENPLTKAVREWATELKELYRTLWDIEDFLFFCQQSLNVRVKTKQLRFQIQSVSQTSNAEILGALKQRRDSQQTLVTGYQGLAALKADKDTLDSRKAWKERLSYFLGAMEINCHKELDNLWATQNNDLQSLWKEIVKKLQ